MRVCWVCHLYPPDGSAGAEWAAHAFLKAAVERGHDASVYLTRGQAEYNYEGVWVRSQPPKDQQHVVIGHLGNAPVWQRLWRRHRAEPYWMAHRADQYRWAGKNTGATWLANSQHVARAAPGPAHVLYPVIDPARCYTEDACDLERGYVTLVNGSAAKGASLFNELAHEYCSDRAFLCVRGAYDKQVVWEAENITLRDTTPTMRDVYRDTRVLLVPSEEESWCMVALEAGLNGIPVIAHPSAGLTESLGAAFIWADRRQPHLWAESLASLDDDADYSTWSRTIWQRSWDVHDMTVKQLEDTMEAMGL